MKMDSSKADMVLCIRALPNDTQHSSNQRYYLNVAFQVEAGTVPESHSVVPLSMDEEPNWPKSRRDMVVVAAEAVRMLSPSSLGVSTNDGKVQMISPATLAGLITGEISADNLLI